MRWMLFFVAMTIAGCGKPEPDNSMSGIVSRIRGAGVANSLDELIDRIGVTPDEYDEGRSMSVHVRFPASDGFVWVTVYHGEKEQPPFLFSGSSIQFSQSGKRE